MNYGAELVKVDIKERVNGPERIATFKDLKTGSNFEIPFGTLLATPPHKSKQVFVNSSLVDENVFLFFYFRDLLKLILIHFNMSIILIFLLSEIVLIFQHLETFGLQSINK